MRMLLINYTCPQQGRVPKYANEAVIRLIRRTFKVHNFAPRKYFISEILSKYRKTGELI